MDRDKNADMGLQYTVAVSSCWAFEGLMKKIIMEMQTAMQSKWRQKWKGF